MTALAAHFFKDIFLLFDRLLSDKLWFVGARFLFKTFTDVFSV